MSVGAQHRPLRHRPRIPILPTTSLGWWAVGITVAFFPLVFAAGAVPGAAALGLVGGSVGGVVALAAVIHDRERALVVLAALVPLAIFVAFVLAELIGG
ncbi:MAG TPA: hypothetical protein VHH55_00910 [Gaiellaceae bacterium]|nr:hypothetical protein [Gaiellaceae bacterium]